MQGRAGMHPSYMPNMYQQPSQSHQMLFSNQNPSQGQSFPSMMQHAQRPQMIPQIIGSPSMQQNPSQQQQHPGQFQSSPRMNSMPTAPGFVPQHSPNQRQMVNMMANGSFQGMVNNMPAGMQGPKKMPLSVMSVNQPTFNLQNCSVNNNRLNFCVRRGNLIQPFRLDHNTNTASKTFDIREMFYEELMWREDLDLQLRCFHHEDRFMRINWPKEITVEVNDRKLKVERTGDVWQQQPLLIKAACHSGENMLKISVKNCACVIFSQEFFNN